MTRNDLNMVCRSECCQIVGVQNDVANKPLFYMCCGAMLLGAGCIIISHELLDCLRRIAHVLVGMFKRLIVPRMELTKSSCETRGATCYLIHQSELM